MPGLRQSILETLRILGNHSGCHQLPEHSFFYKGKQFPICARCTGALLGQLAAIPVSIFSDIPNRISLLFLTIMGIDWGIQEAGIKESTNVRRLITGILGGFGLYSLYIRGIKALIKTRKSH